MPFFKTITIISGTVAGLCVLALPIWALGVPGVENEYAKGWKMGLNTLLLYPVAWLVTYLPYFGMRNRITENARDRWQLASGAVALLLLLMAAARLFQAFKTMR